MKQNWMKIAVVSYYGEYQGINDKESVCTGWKVRGRPQFYIGKLLKWGNIEQRSKWSAGVSYANEHIRFPIYKNIWNKSEYMITIK